MNKYFTLILFIAIASSISFSQNITLTPVQGSMTCAVKVPDLERQSFALGVPETIGSSEGMILNFPETSISWYGPDQDGKISHQWTSPGKIHYSVVMVPHSDYVDLVMTIKNISNNGWTNVFSFNCLNPVNAPQFLDWTLDRTYMSKDGKPFRMDGTTRVNTGQMKTVQFYLHKDYNHVSPFVNGFGAISPDRTDDSYIVTMSEDGGSYMAATSTSALFLFDNLDRCCIHSATDFGDMPRGAEKTVTSRFYLAKGDLDDFLKRFESEVKNVTEPRVAMCWGKPWELADTSKWNYVYNNIDTYKFYIGNIDLTALPRLNRDTVKQFVSALIKKDIKIAIELGGLLDWHASKGNMAGESSFQQDWANVQEFIKLIKEIDPNRNIDILDMDGPIRRMLFPNNKKENYHTIESAVDELFEVVKWWKDSIPTIDINLLTNFPNWAWGDTPAYFKIDGEVNGYGYYLDVLNAIKQKSTETGLTIDALTIDNPFDYATGKAQTNQPDKIAGVDWMKRIAELSELAKAMGLEVNMIFNTNGGRTAQGYAEQTLELIELYHREVGIPGGYWIQSWYQLPDKWLPETEDYTMTNITLKAIKRIIGEEPEKEPALLEPEDGRVYHGVQTMTYGGSVDDYLNALNDATIQPAVRGIFFSIPGTRGPEKSLKELGEFFEMADSVGYIPELSLFLVSDVATDSIIAVSDEYDWIIDSIATLSGNYGKRMFLRIGGEFNGVWNGYHPYLYVSMFQKIVDMFAAKGFRDSIAVNWCYEPDAGNDFDSVDAKGALWYPGDEYVDWFGLDVFDSEHFDQALPDSDRRGITRKGKSERFLAMAREKGKPVFLSETSAKGINISGENQDGIDDWNNWFVKFWEFIAAHTEIKGFAYINTDWPEGAYPGWGDARIENSTYITDKYREEMQKPKYIHLPFSEKELFRATPITEMGRSLYKGFGGGLYPDGTNFRPEKHNNAGILLANSIGPRDQQGNISQPNGKIVLLSIGMSNTSQEYTTFERLLDTFSLANPALVSVNGAQGGQTASIINNPEAEFWDIIETQRLPSRNVTSKQVQVVWLKEANHVTIKDFPPHADSLKEDLKKIVQILLRKYPNLKLVYISSRTYGGYATTQLNPEPYAYESGFSVKWLIQEQIEGDPELDYSESPAKAPWLSFGPYLWASGPNPREDGLVWLEEDFAEDGTHPSLSGRDKVAKMLLDFFASDETTVPWFLTKPVSVADITESKRELIFPNPASEYIDIMQPSEGLQPSEGSIVKIYNTFGECVISVETQDFASLQRINISHLPIGLYFIQIGNYSEKFMVVR